MVRINQHLGDEDKDISVDEKDQKDWEQGTIYAHQAEELGEIMKNVLNQKGSPSSKPKKNKKKKSKTTTGGIDLTAMAPGLLKN